ncbi:unnamed protein product [Hymenolepis diminuta]|nr:unnamed protein product [Hymenolepis diminuta]
MMGEHPGKSVRDISPNIFKCLKEQQCIKSVLLQHLTSHSNHAFLVEVSLGRQNQPKRTV